MISAFCFVCAKQTFMCNSLFNNKSCEYYVVFVEFSLKESKDDPTFA